MILEILIAQYSENEQIIKPLLDSIAIQQGINFDNINVIIANDGSNTILNDCFLKQYSYHIDYYLKDHEGLSGTRNYLLDKATADYVMFCDADDIFLSTIALNLIFSEIKKEEFDYLTPDILMEIKNSEGNFGYLNIKEQPLVHGKVLRRQYLLDKKIRWDPQLIRHDSRYFLGLCESCTNKIRKCHSPYYIWKYNANSITHETEGWFLKTYSYYSLGIIHLVDELIQRGLIQAAAIKAQHYLYFTYFLYNSTDWQKEENKECVENVLKTYSIFYKKYASIIDILDDTTKNSIVCYERNAAANRQKSTYLEIITFDNWKKMILEIDDNGGDNNGNN